jgi:cell division protein FtsW
MATSLFYPTKEIRRSDYQSDQVSRVVEAKPDFILLFSAILLVAFGALMVFSSTAMLSLDGGSSSVSFLKKHVLSIILGLVCAYGCFKVNPSIWKGYAIPLVISSLCVLALVVVFGSNAGGATRWIQLGPMRLQPGEFVKVVTVIALAAYADHFKHRMGSFLYGVFYPGLFLSCFAVLFLLQPDFGSTSVICLVAGCQLFLVVGLSHFLSVGVVAGLMAGVLVAVSPYRMRRFVAFLDPFSDPTSSGYQLIQSLIAVGSGGFFGQGLGVSKQKLFYLPAAHTDFIFAVISEEFGMFGAMFVVAMFLIILYRGLRVTFLLADDIFHSLMALGLTALIVLPAFLNMGVVLGLLPTKGLVLPFISFGGTAMIASCCALGLLLRLSRLADKVSQAEQAL